MIAPLRSLDPVPLIHPSASMFGAGIRPHHGWYGVAVGPIVPGPGKSTSWTVLCRGRRPPRPVTYPWACRGARSKAGGSPCASGSSCRSGKRTCRRRGRRTRSSGTSRWRRRPPGWTRSGSSITCSSAPMARRSGILECWTVLAAIAEATRRVELGTLVMCTGFRNAALLAKMAATLDDVSGGRLILGIGSGWHDPEFDAFGYPKDHKVSRFEEALAVIVGLIRTGRADLDGRYRDRPRRRAHPAGPARPADPDRRQGPADAGADRASRGRLESRVVRPAGRAPGARARRAHGRVRAGRARPGDPLDHGRRDRPVSGRGGARDRWTTRRPNRPRGSSGLPTRSLRGWRLMRQPARSTSSRHSTRARRRRSRGSLRPLRGSAPACRSEVLKRSPSAGRALAGRTSATWASARAMAGRASAPGRRRRWVDGRRMRRGLI